LTDSENQRAALAKLADLIEAHFGDRLVGLYLFGSLAAGGFYPGRSDLDLFAVLESEVADDTDLEALRAVHGQFEAAHPAWRDRIEVLYISRSVLQTFDTEPRGRVARISPGEPLHHRDLLGNIGWNIDWHSVLNGGETLFGPPPLTLGPPVSEEAFLAAVRRQLDDWRALVRDNTVAYVPAQQGYIVASVSRALYALATGAQTSKEKAIAWYAQSHPADADYVWAAYHAYRADVRGPHARLVRFVDEANAEADGEPGPTA
jgi:predicted nucleotidyltransferase